MFSSPADPVIAEESPTHGSRALGAYNPSLDGLRWIAMSVMLAFHAGFTWGQGAAFSLSQFFTLSGFLITSLLLRNRGSDGRPDLRQFWVKRFRRLMPAAMLTLAAIVVFAIPFADASQLAKLPGQVTSALFYVVNWYFVFTDQSYVAQFASPSPVVHFWSLAVEEQFYVVMPLLLVVLLRRTASMKVLAAFFAGAALLSAAWMVTLYHLGASIDRLYYGTDTRAAEFLVGAALACWLLHRPLHLSQVGRAVLTTASLVVMAITVVLWTSVPLTDPALYQGGFFLFSLLTVVLITALHTRSGPLPVAFSWAPLAALGRITYGVYLVQWPIFLWLDEERMGLSRWPLLIFQLTLILAISTAMYHLVEIPIRSGRMLGSPRAWLAPVGLAACICLGVVIVGSTGSGDPLAPLQEIASDAPPVAPVDQTLDVMLISDDSGDDLVDAVAALGDEMADVEVSVGPSFGCAPNEGESPVCDEWQTAWTDAIDEVDPDVVVLAATDWTPEEIAAASGLDPDASPEELLAWTESAMMDGIDILTSDGAAVFWAPYLTTDLVQHLVWVEEPFGRVMMGLPSVRDDLEAVRFSHPGTIGVPVDDPAYHEDNAAVLVEQARSFRGVRPGGATRILVVGDSISASLGVGLERWAEETGEATVWTASLPGCGFIYEGEIIFPLLDTEAALPSHCEDVEKAWQDQVDSFDPDVVLVSSTVWDLVDRRLPEWEGFLEPGDERFDDFVLDRYRLAVDTFSSEGAEIVWLDAPCFDGDFQAAADHMNASLLERLTTDRPDDLEIYPFAELVCPEGVNPQELGGVSDPRPDKVHYSPDAAYWIAQELGPLLVG